MRFSEYLGFSFSNLREMKLRTALTAFGVTIGIGALVAMVGFGSGMQKNVEPRASKSSTFSTPSPFCPAGRLAGSPVGIRTNRGASFGAVASGGRTLDDAAVSEIGRWRGVESVFPEIRFPADRPTRRRARNSGWSRSCRPGSPPRSSSGSPPARLSPGTTRMRSSSASRFSGCWTSTDPERPWAGMFRISSLAFDLEPVSNPRGHRGDAPGRRNLPFKKETYEFPIVGVTESLGFGGPSPLASDVFFRPGRPSRINKLPFTNIWDLFRAGEGRGLFRGQRPALFAGLRRPGQSRGPRRWASRRSPWSTSSQQIEDELRLSWTWSWPPWG